MTITELIYALQKQLERQGDVPVIIWVTEQDEVSTTSIGRTEMHLFPTKDKIRKDAVCAIAAYSD